MKAVYIAEPGGPDKLIFGDRPDPEAGAGEIIVRLRGTALNHADLSIRAGRSPTGGLPRILGLDIAGEVASLGPGVAGSKAGDRVVVENRVKCDTGSPCALGRDEFCERQRRLGGEVDGGHAQYCTGPDLGETAKAHEVMAGRDFFGKLVLRVPQVGPLAFVPHTIRGREDRR